MRQAFDKIKHSAVIEALFEKQVPLQLTPVLVAWWSQSEVSVRLQSVSSHRKIRVQRGVPQERLNPRWSLSLQLTAHWEICNQFGLSQMQAGPLIRLLAVVGVFFGLYR